LSGGQVGYASLQWLSSPCPITTQKCPGNASSNFRQNQRQRIRKSERLFISPDFLLTSHPSKDGMSPTSNLQVIMSSQSSQPFRDVRKYLRDYLRHQLRKEWQLSPTLPVGLTPDQNQERPEATHAGGSCSGIADADEVQCWVSRPSTATRLQHWKEALEATQTPKERTIIDARYVECFTFCRQVLLQCAALCCDTHASHRRRQHLRVQ